MGFHPEQIKARERLSTFETELSSTGNAALAQIEFKSQLQSAIEITSALIGLELGIKALAEEVKGSVGQLAAAIDKGTAQATKSSNEAANLAAKNAGLSRQLNWLTKWIIGAAIISAVAALIQSGGVVFQIFHPSSPQILAIPLLR